MEIVFKDPKLETLYYEPNHHKRSPEIIKKFIRVVNFIRAAKAIHDVYARTSFHCEKLKGDLSGHMSIRLNDGRRLIFSLEKQGQIQVVAIEKISNHYG